MANDPLAEKANEKTDDVSIEHLRRLVAEYEARLAEMSEVAAHVRHEINNPLTGVLGQAQLLLREDLSDASRRRVQTIEQLAVRIRDTASHLHAIEQARAVGTQPEPRAIEHDVKNQQDEPPRH